MTKIQKRDEVNQFAKLITDWRSIAVVHAVYEHHALRYVHLSKMLGFSPTVLSNKLAKLVESGIIVRTSNPGVKEVIYSPTELAKDIVCAYHILEGVSAKLHKTNVQHVKTNTCELIKERYCNK